MLNFLFETGFDTDDLTSSVFQGGETDALIRLGRHLERKVIIARIISYNALRHIFVIIMSGNKVDFQAP